MPRKEPASVLFVRFPYGRSESPEVTDWMMRVAVQCSKDERISRADTCFFNDTPITMTRNAAAQAAIDGKYDLLVMVDNDMAPDLIPGTTRPFWQTAFDKWWEDDEPMLIGAPYCGPPPHNNVYVFRWENWVNPEQATEPCGNYHLVQFTRAEAAIRVGFERVDALPTGLILIDTRVFAKLSKKHEMFYYEWTNERALKKDSTEDVTFTRDCGLAGVPLYVLWDAWAGHFKTLCVGKPVAMTVDAVRENLRGVLLEGGKPGERVMIAQDNLPAAERKRLESELQEQRIRSKLGAACASAMHGPQEQRIRSTWSESRLSDGATQGSLHATDQVKLDIPAPVPLE